MYTSEYVNEVVRGGSGGYYTSGLGWGIIVLM